jgi:response regulator NasT
LTSERNGRRSEIKDGTEPPRPDPVALSALGGFAASPQRGRLDEIAAIVDALGHKVVARPLEVQEIAKATRREHPDVAIVALGEGSEHALELISGIVKQAACPVIADIAADDPDFIDEAAKRGIFAYIRHSARKDMESAIDIVLHRYAEFSRLEGAFSRRATIEQAKGILMKRYGINAEQAFAKLRRHARDTNQTVFDVAEAVTRSHPLFRARDAAED